MKLLRIIFSASVATQLKQYGPKGEPGCRHAKRAVVSTSSCLHSKENRYINNFKFGCIYKLYQWNNNQQERLSNFYRIVIIRCLLFGNFKNRQKLLYYNRATNNKKTLFQWPFKMTGGVRNGGNGIGSIVGIM